MTRKIKGVLCVVLFWLWIVSACVLTKLGMNTAAIVLLVAPFLALVAIIGSVILYVLVICEED